MYNIKDVIYRLKEISNVESNIDLANSLNVSYNTLNTWIKRGKLPQDTLIDFATKYNSSLDYILFGKEYLNNNSLFNNSATNDISSSPTFIYYGEYTKLNITKGSKLTLDKSTIHSGSYCLINIDNLYIIVQIKIDFITNNIEIFNNNSSKTISLLEFNNINLGMITSIELV